MLIVLTHIPKVCGVIPGQGTDLGCGFSPSWGVYGRQPANVPLCQIHVSLSLSRPSSLTLINVSLGEDYINNIHVPFNPSSN